jgi:hypothetical protein
MNYPIKLRTPCKYFNLTFKKRLNKNNKSTSLPIIKKHNPRGKKLYIYNYFNL